MMRMTKLMVLVLLMKDGFGGGDDDDDDLAFSVKSFSHCPPLSDLESSFFISISCMFAGPEWNL